MPKHPLDHTIKFKQVQALYQNMEASIFHTVLQIHLLKYCYYSFYTLYNLPTKKIQGRLNGLYYLRSVTFYFFDESEPSLVSSLGHFLFYRCVRAVTHLILVKTDFSTLILYATGSCFVNTIFRSFVRPLGY